MCSILACSNFTQNLYNRNKTCLTGQPFSMITDSNFFDDTWALRLLFFVFMKKVTPQSGFLGR